MMFGEYLGVVVLAVIAAAICAVFIGGSWLFGPKKRTPYKLSTYECGVQPVGSTKERFPIKFYLVAILFILFDVEVVFLWSWFVAFAHADLAFKQFTYVEFALYMSTWFVGYLYVIRINAIDWDDAVSLDPAKLGLKEPGRLVVEAGDVAGVTQRAEEGRLAEATR
jgi:NADH-quinone oxidoreductase subunit A